ncbi:hypothetical protein YC2023_085398 [Brassica napus]
MWKKEVLLQSSRKCLSSWSQFAADDVDHQENIKHIIRKECANHATCHHSTHRLNFRLLVRLLNWAI